MCPDANGRYHETAAPAECPLAGLLDTILAAIDADAKNFHSAILPHAEDDVRALVDKTVARFAGEIIPRRGLRRRTQNRAPARAGREALYPC